MLGDISKAEKIYVACGYTDMRKSINGLVALVVGQFHLDPQSSGLFLFCGKRRIASRRCFGRKTGLCCCTSGWRMGITNGRGRRCKRGR